MKMRFFFLVMLILSSALLCADEDLEQRYTMVAGDAMQDNCPPASEWNRFISRYTSTCIPAIAIGAACGASCHFTDQFIVWPIDWILWRDIRLNISSSVKESMKECNIECDETVFDQVALVSAWISYFACLKNQRITF